ncbi:MAG TPA: CYTH domain-containing protein [Candidatus Wunengus sp. YC60]|uniref:CYTH domain-containing protein n=1 Tax=Candidatus Wunengus sp. YC60 TaxID=3367697 RepID=UPI00402953B0
MQTGFHNNREKTEIEAKFVCPDGVGLDDLLAAIDTINFKYTRENPCSQTDVYLDTSDYTLLNSDAALRIRRRGENYVGAYKASERQQGAIFERREFEWTLSNDEKKLWNEEKKPAIPPVLIEKLHLQGQALRKVLVAETQRHTAIIIGNEGFKAELSLDEVAFRGHKGQKTYREIEIELLSGQFEQLKQFANSLQNQLKLQPAIDSKYKKGMILVGKYGVEPAI